MRKLDTACEWTVVGLVMAIALWGPLGFGGTPPASFLVMEGLTVLALLVWALRLWTQRSCRMFWAPVCWAAALFLLYAAVRCRIVLLEYAAHQELIRVAVYGAVFFLVVNNFNRRQSVMGMAILLIGLAAVESWVGMFQYITKHPTVWGYPRPEQFIERGGGTYVNPDHLAGLLDMTIPLGLAFTFMSRYRHSAKILFAYATLSMLVGLGLTLSRGGFAATLGALVVFGIVQMYRKGYWLPALAIVATVVALGIAFNVGFGALEERFGKAFSKGHLVDIRSWYWPAAIQIFQHHPWWGGGPGHFDAEFAQYRPPVVQIRPIYAHNDYLNTLAEWGVVGLAIVVLACVLVYYSAWKSWPAFFEPDEDGNVPQKSNKAALIMGASIGLLGMLFHSVVDFNMHIPANAIIAVILMGLITLHLRFVSDRFWKRPGMAGKVFLTGIILAAAGWMGAQEAQGAREAWWLHRRVASEDEWVENLKKAYEIQPKDYVIPYNIAEHYRVVSFQGNPDYEKAAREALSWYEISMKLNPLDCFVPMRYGMTLDWLGRTNEAGIYFDRAEKLDPNNGQLAYYVGRHYMEMNDYRAAEQWYKRCLDLVWMDEAFASLKDLYEREKEPYGLYKK